MKREWSRKEKLASAVIGSIATIFLITVLAKPISSNLAKVWLNTGIAFNGFALALSPHILFEKISLKNFKENGLIMFGASALLMFMGEVLMLLAAVYWFLGYAV